MTYTGAIDLIKAILASKEFVYAIATITMIKIISQSSREHRKTRSKIHELSLLVSNQRRLIKKEIYKSKFTK